ncbi:hypothetical protein SKAU_G00325640 [Synaphobranchus kaupii]|uniref:Uncharacterized protein n=1 Tax=Synaphobranchus kaupii TaxID=118154 RepID=A0A9Q1EPS5_SYNKA|nr:hypothetical protein SKAU_G00325640 [Synaphobranchus kaupii]
MPHHGLPGHAVLRGVRPAAHLPDPGEIPGHRLPLQPPASGQAADRRRAGRHLAAGRAHRRRAPPQRGPLRQLLRPKRRLLPPALRPAGTAHRQGLLHRGISGAQPAGLLPVAQGRRRGQPVLLHRLLRRPLLAAYLPGEDALPAGGGDSRHHHVLGGDLRPAHKQRPQPHPLHPDHQLLPRAGGAAAVSLAEALRPTQGTQEPHHLRHLHGRPAPGLLPPPALPAQDSRRPHRRQVRMTGRGKGGEGGRSMERREAPPCNIPPPVSAVVFGPPPVFGIPSGGIGRVGVCENPTASLGVTFGSPLDLPLRNLFTSPCECTEEEVMSHDWRWRMGCLSLWCLTEIHGLISRGVLPMDKTIDNPHEPVSHLGLIYVQYLVHTSRWRHFYMYSRPNCEFIYVFFFMMSGIIYEGNVCFSL